MCKRARTAWCTRSLILQEQRRLNIEVDNHEAVKIGDVEENSEAIKVVKPQFNKEIYLRPAVRKGVDELALDGVLDPSAPAEPSQASVHSPRSWAGLL